MCLYDPLAPCHSDHEGDTILPRIAAEIFYRIEYL